MSDFQSCTIDGIFTLQTPLHISDPRDDYRYDPRRHRLVPGGSNIGFPATRTRTMPYLIPNLEGEDKRGGPTPVGVIPASSLRGRLRREGSKEIEQYCNDVLGAKLTMQTYQALHCGAISGNPKGDAPSLDEVRGIRDHVFLGLFGGGARMTHGRLRIQTAVPVLAEFIDPMGLVPDAYAGYAIPAADAWRLLTPVPVVRKDDLVTFEDSEAEQIIANYEQAMADQFAAETERRKARKTKADGETNGDAAAETERRKARKTKADGETNGDAEEPARGLRAISAYEVVVPGTSFYVNFTIDRGTFAQAGLLLNALVRLVQQRERGLGGKAATGLGRFSHQLRMRVDEQQCTPFTIDDGMAELNTDAAVVAQMDDALNAALKGLQPDTLHRMVMGEAA